MGGGIGGGGGGIGRGGIGGGGGGDDCSTVSDEKLYDICVASSYCAIKG